MGFDLANMITTVASMEMILTYNLRTAQRPGRLLGR
jgi:hypothetical protein